MMVHSSSINLQCRITRSVKIYFVLFILIGCITSLSSLFMLDCSPVTLRERDCRQSLKADESAGQLKQKASVGEWVREKGIFMWSRCRGSSIRERARLRARSLQRLRRSGGNGRPWPKHELMHSRAAYLDQTLISGFMNSSLTHVCGRYGHLWASSIEVRGRSWLLQSVWPDNMGLWLMFWYTTRTLLPALGDKWIAYAHKYS